MDEEKLVVFILEDEIIDSIVRIPSELGIHFYCEHNGLKLLETIDMCAFTAVFVEFK